jgi:RNA polymerase sporulation-specific sigma factor
MQPRSADHWTCADADEALLCRVWQGDEDALDALLNRYRSLVRTKAHSYFLVGGDREDVVQEGMIGLYKAIRDFDAAKQMTFRGFADLCVTRQIISAIKTATRQKHSPLNGYVSLHLPAYQDDEPEQELVDHVVSADLDPADRVVSSDDLARMRAYFSEMLSEFEADVLQRYVAGETYQEIAAELGRHVKSIDNALQRIKRKVDTYLKSRRLEGAL